MSTKKNNLLVLTETRQEMRIVFSVELQNEHVTGQPYILIGIDRYSDWPVIQIYRSTEAKQVMNFLENG